MRRATVAVLISAGVAVAPAVAAVPAVSPAQSSGTLTVSSSTLTIGASAGAIPAVPEVDVRIPVTLEGGLTVRFHGDVASGCAARGTCGYAGTIYVQMPATGTIHISKYRDGRVAYGFLSLPSDAAFGSGEVTTARVSSASAGAARSALTCSDAQERAGVALASERGHFVLSLARAKNSLLRTRCAGPSDSDALARLPEPSIGSRGPVSNRTLSVVASRSFQTHGFSGTVVSSLTLHLGRARRSILPSPLPSPGFHEVDVAYRATLRGTSVITFAGDRDGELCGPLASCGSSGVLTAPAPQSAGVGELTILGSAKRPFSDLLSVAGLARHGGGGTVFGLGFASWTHPGPLEARVGQSGVLCTDAVAADGIDGISLDVQGNRLVALWVASGTMRTDCPGPYATGTLASGSVPVSALRRRIVTIHLRAGGSFTDDGYGGRSDPHLTLTLTRTRVVELTAQPQSG